MCGTDLRKSPLWQKRKPSNNTIQCHPMSWKTIQQYYPIPPNTMQCHAKEHNIIQPNLAHLSCVHTNHIRVFDRPRWRNLNWQCPHTARSFITLIFNNQLHYGSAREKKSQIFQGYFSLSIHHNNGRAIEPEIELWKRAHLGTSCQVARWAQGWPLPSLIHPPLKLSSGYRGTIIFLN